MRKSNGNLAANSTLYWSMTPGVVAETDLAGTLKSEYVFFDGERVARKDFPGNAVFYYFSDHLKTASVITDSAGAIKAESDYYPWGGELKFVDNDTNDYKFTGKKRDLETGLDYYGARYYSNGLGRWVSADWSATPIPVPYADLTNPQSLNLYGFVGGNPASKADPDGHECPTCPKVVDTIEQVAHDPEVVGTALAGIAAKTFLDTVKVGGGIGLLAAPSVTAMTVVAVGPKFEVPGDGACGGDCSAFYIPPPVQGQGQQTQTQNQGQTQTEEPNPLPEPAPASGGAMKGGGDKPGEVYATEPQASGKPYVGRTAQGTDKRMQTRTDGRTGQATTIDTYKTRQQGRYKEQKAIDQHGGKQA